MFRQFAGMGKVFSFTLRQLLKNKSNRIVFGTMLVLAALAVPVMSLLPGAAAGFAGGEAVTAFVSVSTVEEYLGGGQIGFDMRYGVQYAYSIAVLILCVFSVTYIVRAIVDEKVSRLVETLLVSVRPMALVLGKILAVMVFIMMVLAAFALVACLSYLATGLVQDVSFMGSLPELFGISPDLMKLGPEAVLIILVSLFLAYLFFSLIAGLAGAGCSNMDEIESANMAAMGAILAGYLISCIAFAVSSGPAAVFLALCPVVSAFTAPVFYVLGDIGMGMAAASWGLEILCIAGLLLLTARVYDSLILYKGNRVKLTGILRMAAGKGGRKK